MIFEFEFSSSLGTGFKPWRSRIEQPRYSVNLIITILSVIGGCGAMYEVMVVSPEFGGLKLIKQHMLVNKV